MGYMVDLVATWMAWLRRHPLFRRLVQLLPDTAVVRHFPLLGGPFAFSLRRHRWLMGRHPFQGHLPALGIFQKLVSPGAVVYDVGANIGYYSRFFLAGCTVNTLVAFEPMKANVRLLRRNLQPYVKRAVVMPVALGEYEGTAKLQVDDVSDGSATLDTITAGEASEGRRSLGLSPRIQCVSIRRLDRLVESDCLPPPHFIKIDVEGAEAMVLRGAAGLLQQHRPRLAIALHGPQVAREVLDFLNSAGYACYGWLQSEAPNYAQLTPTDASRLADNNIVACAGHEVAVIASPLPPLVTPECSSRHRCLSGKLRVVVTHPSLAHYRVPLFRKLASQADLDICVLHGSERRLPNAQPEGFRAAPAAIWEAQVGRRPVYWQNAQIQWADRTHSDVLVLDWNVHYASLVPALLRARANRVGTVLWGHGYSKKQSESREYIRHAVARLADAVLFYSRPDALKFVATRRFDPRRVFVAPNALDQAPIAAARQYWEQHSLALEEFRRRQDLCPGPLILFVSRLDAGRRIDLLLQAASMLRREFPSLRVAIIGSGDYEACLRARARQLSLQRHVLFPGASHDEMELAPWFLSAQVYCQPGQLGLSILHAFGYGVPVVTTGERSSHGPEVAALEEGYNGLRSAADNAQALAAALRQILSDSVRRAQLSQAALRTASQEYTLGRMVEGFQAAVRFAWHRATGG